MTANDNAPASASPPAATGKPRFALFIATAAGLGYIPFAPGTFGSLVGVLLALLPFWLLLAAALAHGASEVAIATGAMNPIFWLQGMLALATAALGVWSAGIAANHWVAKDPQRVVIDEVSGQHLTLVLGCGLPIAKVPAYVSTPSMLAFVPLHNALNWKYLLLGFILFRVFDIWKPFPARQAESLPGGWGIMADDWVAAIYAALGLWIARAAGL